MGSLRNVSLSSFGLVTLVLMLSKAYADEDTALTVARPFDPEISFQTGEKFYKAAPIQPPICPEYWSEFQEVRSFSERPGTYLVPHTKILADGHRCSTATEGNEYPDDEYFWVIPHKLIQDERSARASELMDAWNIITSNIRAFSAFTGLIALDPVVVGIEMGDRVCNGNVYWKKHSIFLFLQAENKHVNFSTAGWLHNYEVGALAYHPPETPSSRAALCIIKNSTLPGPTGRALESPDPLPASPAPSSFPNAWRALDEDSDPGNSGTASESPTLPPSSSDNPVANSTNNGTASESPTPTPSSSVKPSPSTSPSPSNSPAANSSDNICFPAGAVVELESGSMVTMDRVSVGDRVKVGVDTYSEVFMFTHKLSDVKNEFVTLTTRSGHELALTSRHYIYANGFLVAAASVKVGDTLTLENGSTSQVVKVGATVQRGLYNPQTLQGDIVVGGIVASTYTQSVHPTLAHALLSPVRMLHSSGASVLSTLFHRDGHWLADLLPSGGVSFV